MAMFVVVAEAIGKRVPVLPALGGMLCISKVAWQSTGARGTSGMQGVAIATSNG